MEISSKYQSEHSQEKEYFLHVAKCPGDTHLFSDFAPFAWYIVCSLNKDIYKNSNNT